MGNQDPKKVVLTGVATVAKALAHPSRAEILELLAQGEKSVEALAERAGLSVANASQHLRLMRAAGLLSSRRDGKHIIYGVSDDAAINVIGGLRNVAERHLAEVREVIAGYFHDRDAMEPVSREELISRLKVGGVTVLDVRPPDEYQAGHVPGAVNIPLRELEERLRELPAGQEVVAYCRGPYCVLAFEAVARLRDRGVSARRLQDGYPEWKAAGLPVEQADSEGISCVHPPS